MSRIRFRIKIEHLWALIILVGIFIFVNTHPVRPYDFWWHITVGREILTTGHIPTTDIYSYTEIGQSYPSYQMFWLMEAILYFVYKTGGLSLVVFFQAVLVTSAYGLIFWICKRVTNSWRLGAVGTLFAAALGMNDWNVRPQGITFLLASLILMAIYEYRRKPRWTWLVIIPICMLVWANSHGTFFIGLILISLWLGQSVWKAIKYRIKHEIGDNAKQVVVPAIILGISALVCLINPRGLGIIDYLKTLTSNSIIQNLVTEWAPPTFTSLMGIIFFIGLIGSGLLLIFSPKHPDIYQIVTYLVFGIIGLRTSRGSVWFGLVTAPIMAEHLSEVVNRFRKPAIPEGNQKGAWLVNYLFVLLIMVMGVITLPWFKSTLPLPTVKAGLISGETPVEATQVLLAEHPPKQVFNAMSFGSYLIWAAYPQYQVFVDSRIELFPEDIWLDYLDISNANEDWETKLSDYGINTLMLSPAEQPLLIKAAVESGQWKLFYQDTAAILFERK